VDKRRVSASQVSPMRIPHKCQGQGPFLPRLSEFELGKAQSPLPRHERKAYFPSSSFKLCPRESLFNLRLIECSIRSTPKTFEGVCRPQNCGGTSFPRTTTPTNLAMVSCRGCRREGSLQAHGSSLDFMNPVPTNRSSSQHTYHLPVCRNPGRRLPNRQTQCDIALQCREFADPNPHLGKPHSRVQRKGMFTCNNP
jgi:hypothetical protein